MGRNRSCCVNQANVYVLTSARCRLCRRFAEDSFRLRWRSFTSGLCSNFAAARAINRQLMALHMKLFVEANPIPVKWAMAQMKKMSAGIRLPLVPLSGEAQTTVHAALHANALI